MTKDEYNQILFKLGLLDDEDDWELYRLQEKRFELSEEGYEVWSKHTPLVQWKE